MSTGAADTIFAVSSGAGRAAVTVIRVSGPASHRALAAMTRRMPAAREAALRRLVDPAGGDPLDDALVIRFDSPASETGEDMIELQVHGGRAVVGAVLAALGRLDGLRPAAPGEFARRAFANGKLDLTQAEGLADLIEAETEAQRRQALRQAGGSLQRLYDSWRDRLIQAQALVEAAIDFSDEADVAADAFDHATAIVRSLAGELDAHMASGSRGEILRDGFKVVIAGPPNAGKSSVLNALARRDVAIVSPEAGTTRDVIETRLDIGGVPVLVADTAGLREGDAVGTIELEGMRRTRDQARVADLVLWLVDAQVPVWSPPADLAVTVLVVVNKCDLGAPVGGGAAADIAISARSGQGIEELIAKIGNLAQSAAGDGVAIVPTSLRQRQHLQRAAAALADFLEGAVADAELRAEELRVAATELGRITGRIDAEDVLDRVFARFCIGK
ncbi:MAG: tRNA uridine-5-carboxymethylaminomethyl(34) synthesis GTPase MnmE [Hyphomicrobiaceae bacterium]